MQPKISIIIPVYNVEKYLNQCLDSVVNQSLKEIEIICVNDASPDTCPKILDKYAQKDNRILVIHKKNEGQGVAKNSGLKQANGKYVLFLDGDDWLEAGALQKMYEVLEENKAEVAIFNTYKYYEKTGKKNFYNFSAPYYEKFKTTPFSSKEAKEIIYKINALAFKIYKKSALEEYGFQYTSHRRIEDHLPFFVFFAQAKRIIVIPDALLNYRIQENSATFTIDKHIDDFFDNFYCCYELINNQDELKEFLPQFLNYKINSFFYYQNLVAPKKRRKYYNNLRKIFKHISLNNQLNIEKKYYKKINAITKMPYFFHNICSRIFKTYLLLKTHL